MQLNELKRKNPIHAQRKDSEPTPPQENPLMKPEALIENYQIAVPFYGIPPEVLNNLLLMLTEIAKHQAPMQAEISKLPTWEDWEKGIQPRIETATNGLIRATRDCQGHIEREIRSQTSTMTTSISQTITDKIKKLEATLQARDMWEWKLRFKWMGIGATVLLVLWGLLWLLRIYL